MEAGKRTINDIFNGNRRLIIPFFQRAYVWGPEQWERLLEDMEMISSTNREYFFGSIILKSNQTTSDVVIGDERTIVDGQQRLTTIAIFLKVLGLLTSDEWSIDRMFLLKGETLAIQHSQNDIGAFERIMKLKSLETIESGRSNILRAYEYFREHIDPSKLNLQFIQNNAQFVGIDLLYHEDEQQIFDTINSLGVKLTTGELLKNFFFTQKSITDYETYWKPVFEEDDECKEFWDQEITSGRLKRNNIEVFLSAFLQIQVYSAATKIRTEDKVVYRRYDKLFVNYKHFISNYIVTEDSDSSKQETITNFIASLTSYAKIYRDNFDSSILNMEVGSIPSIERLCVYIFGLDGTVIIPYVLYLLKNVTDETELQNMFRYLESYLMRRYICRSTNKSYSDLFSESLIGNNIQTFQDLKAYIDEKDMETALAMPSNITLKRAIHEDKMTNTRAHGILYMLESKLRNHRKHATTLLGYKSYSLEHLMPKNWRVKWGATEDEDTRDHKILTLGNLAIITSSLNSSIRDAKWSDKLNGRGNKKGLKTYASGLVTMEDVLPSMSWAEDNIADRADWIADKVIDCWPSYALGGEEVSDDYENGSEVVLIPSVDFDKKRNVNQDWSRFSLNGSEYMNKGKFVRTVIREYMKIHPDMTFDALQLVFHSELLETGYRHKGLLCPIEIWDSWTNEYKYRRYYVSGDDCIFESSDGRKFYVNTQWTLKSVKNIIDIAQREGFVVEKNK